MDDLISRQDAVDALNVGAELLRRALDCTDIVGAEREKYEWGLGLIESFITDMKEVPSAQQWTPCSERLPEEVGHYLITVKLDVSLFVTADDYFSYGWDDFGDSVIAWTPLPEPYKGEET